MKRNRFRRFFQQRQYAIVSFIFFAAIAAMTGVYFSNKITSENNKNQIAQKETELETEGIEDVNEDKFAFDSSLDPDSILNEKEDIPNEDAVSVNSVIKPTETDTKAEQKEEDTASDEEITGQSGQSGQSEDQNETTVDEQKGTKENTAAQGKAADTSSLHFSPEKDLSWPLQGDVILNYSMDQTVYFATLEQYKYNPALIIAGNVNDPVNAAATGKITDISTNEETGVTVTMELGDGYSAVYGQLKEVLYKEGASVEAGNAIGYIAEPTKYYSVEGSNLYFSLLKDGEPVDPMQYIE